ncbi:MAG TPA: oligosaccharide flippase family protein [Solirubrobacteraceae bacterium]|jgi:lipopolysaccharide exporter|nr:oligosaccharide flippase family protein [Solirubrobacteraceae bacterium]
MSGDPPRVEEPPEAAGPMGDELREAAAHGVRWATIARPVIEVIQLGSIIVLARLIVPAEFGRYAVAIIAQEVAYLIVAGGLSAALVQRKTLRREHLQSGMALGLILGLVLTALTLVAAGLVVTPIFGTRTALFVRLLAPLCLVSALGTVPLATLRRRLAFGRLSVIEVLSTVARVAVCISLALAGLGGEALVLGMLAGALTMALATWVSAPPPAPRLHPTAARELLEYGLPASLAAVSWVGFSNVDYAIIGARLGAFKTGLYFRSYTLAVQYQSKVGIVMGQVGFPVLARTSGAAELALMHRKMVRLLTIVMFPLLVLLAIGAPVLVPFMFGPRWTGAVVPTQILALGGASTLVINAAGTVLMATGRARALLGYGMAHFVTYGLTVFLVVRLGIVAVAIDAAVVHTIFLIVAYVLILHGSEERPLQRLWDDIAPAFVSCLGLVAVALPASIALTAAHVPAIVWLLALGLVAPPPYLLALRFGFPAAWRSQRAALARILPGHQRLRGAKRRLAALRVRFSG